MADETATTQAPAADKPAAADKSFIAPGMKSADPVLLTKDDGAVKFAPVTTAKDRLRAFEDEHLGKDAVRIGGEIERGHGSPYAGMRPERRRHYEALEKLVEAEQRLDAANVALTNAKVALETAEADVENAAKLADQRAAEVQAAEKPAPEPAHTGL